MMTPLNLTYRSRCVRGSRSSRRPEHLFALALLACLAIFLGPMALPVPAAPADGGDAASLFPDLSLGRYGQADAGSTGQQKPAQVEANYTALESYPGRVVVSVQVDLNAPWHIYSLTQPKGGPLPTKIKLASSDQLQVVGDWHSDSPPKKSVSQEFSGVTIEEHDGEVTFFALAKILPEGATAESVGEIEVEINALTCVSDGSCQPLRETLTANFTGPTPPGLMASAVALLNGDASSSDSQTSKTREPDVSHVKLYQDDDYAIRWRAYVATPTLHPGEQGRLVFTAIPEGEYHIYPGVTDDQEMSTNFVVEDKAGLLIGAPTTDAEVIEERPIPSMVNRFHAGKVTWTMPIEIPSDVKPGERTIRGAIAYQACTSESCLMPMAMRFEANVKVMPSDSPGSEASAAKVTTIELTSAKAKDVKTLAADDQWVDSFAPASGPQPGSTGAKESSQGTPLSAAAGDSATNLADTEPDSEGASATEFATEAETAMGFPVILGLAFIGGFILNFMPCVLPVVGLKVMSFVQQAGSDRKRAFLLNTSYSAGIMAIYVGLAVAMIAFSMAWGEMFTYFSVRVGLTILMFAMALSYFGFWEIPAPGMASSENAQELQQREGYTGAFFKGMFATVLSTPCSGPFLGGIFALIGGKLPPLHATIVVLVIGAGMAIPYVVMGIWPRLMAWLPKPGPWMETFKEFLAFLFLGTVAFFFYTFNDEDKLWIFVALIGVWFGCWIIGKVPSWQTVQRRLIAWTGGIGVAVAISLLAFQYLGPKTEAEQIASVGVEWLPYDEARLSDLRADGKTVMVDFSAKWCASCLVNLNVAIDTQPTAELVEQLDAVAMYADWTDYNPEIKAKLAELNSNSIPLLAIYPGGNPDQPILLRDLVSQQNVLDALRQAGPSQEAASVANRKPPQPEATTTR